LFVVVSFLLVAYFCFGIGGIFLYDFAVFGWTVINGEMSVNHWVARGFVTAILAIPLGLAALRPIRLSLRSGRDRR